MSVNQEGGCLCGAVRYRVTGEPTWRGACHCTQCQRLTGSAYAVGIYFKESDVEILSGALKQYIYHAYEGGRWIRIQFCELCGTNITWIAESTPGERGIAGGTFDDSNWVDVDTHSWTRSAHHSVSIPPGAVTFPAGPS